MFVNGSTQPPPQILGLSFQLATLDDFIPDGPKGAWVEEDVCARNTVLRERTRGGVIYRFCIHPRGRSESLRRARLPDNSETIGLECTIDLWAEIVEGAEALADLIEQAIATKNDSPELLAFMERMLNTGLELSSEFVEILRQRMDQYWFRTPDPAGWHMVIHYSRSRERWCTFVVEEEMRSRIERRYRTSNNNEYPRQSLILKRIEEADMQSLQELERLPKTTFPEEKVSTALVELHQGRFRSAIVHAVIAYESATKRGLEELMEHRLKGLESAAIVDAISREVSTATLGKVVLGHAENKTKAHPVDWGKIDALYNTRNQIIHRRLKKLPPYESLKGQLLEVRAFVKRIQDALRPSDEELE